MRLLRIIGVLLVIAIVLNYARSVHATAPTCLISGNVNLLSGGNASSVRVYFSYDQAQNTQSSIIAGGSAFSVVTDTNGNLPTGACLPSGPAACPPQGAFMYVAIGTGPITKIQIPLMSTADLSTLILANTDPPSIVSDIASGNTNCSVINPSVGSIGTATITCSGGGGGGTPGGLAGQIQFNNSGAFGGLSLTSPIASTGSAIVFNPTTSVSFNNQSITSVASAVATGEPIIYGQSGSLLHDLTPNASSASQQTVGALLGAQFTLNNEYNPSAPFFGADATGTNDSAIAITNALAAATANATSNTYAASTKLSGGTFKLNEPILISSAWIPALTGHAAPIRLVGAGEYATQLTTGMTAGPMIVAESGWAIASANNGNPIKQAALVTGSSGSAQWASNGSGQWSLDLEELLGVQSVNGDTGLDARGFYNPSVGSPANPEVLAFSGGGIDYFGNSHDSTLDGQIGAYAAYRGTDNALHCQVNLSTSGQIKAVSSNTFTTSAVNEYECSYNGSDLYAILKGTASTGTAGTGTIVQRKDETTLLGGATLYYHFGGWHYWPAGLLDSPEIASVARNVASYTQHTAAYTGDSNSVVLFDGFGTNLTMPASLVPAGTWQWAFEPTYLKGSHITATSGQTGQAWVEAKTTGIGCCGSQIEIGNLDIIGGYGSLMSQVASIKGHDIAIEGGSYIGIETTNSSFNSSFQNIDEGQGELGGVPALSPIVIGGGITSIDNLHTATGIMGPYLGGVSMTNSYIAPSSAALWGIVCNGYCYLANDNEDSENGGTFNGLTFATDPAGAERQFTVIHSIIAQQGSGIAPVKEECSNSIDSKFINNVFNVQNNSLTTEVDSTACSNTFGNPVDFDNNKLNGGGNVDASPPTGVTFINNNQPFSTEGTVSIPPVYAAATHGIFTPFTNATNAKACVSDAAACTSGTTYVPGGGSTKCELNWSGTAWIETGVGYCM